MKRVRRVVAKRWSDKWKLAGDLALIFIPLVNQAVEHSPQASELFKYWAMTICDFSLAGFTFFTKFKQQNHYEAQPEFRDTEADELQ